MGTSISTTHLAITDIWTPKTEGDVVDVVVAAVEDVDVVDVMRTQDDETNVIETNLQQLVVDSVNQQPRVDSEVSEARLLMMRKSNWKMIKSSQLSVNFVLSLVGWCFGFVAAGLLLRKGEKKKIKQQQKKQTFIY